MINTYLVNTNMFDSDCAILVNAVNCKGVMGAGLALQFKNRYPQMFKLYKEKCANDLLKPGDLDEHVINDDSNVKLIVNFATKDDWCKPSKYQFIELGIKRIAKRIKFGMWDDYLSGNYSIAIPALGCGLGGLEWEIVKPLIIKNLEIVETDNKWHIYIFEPQ